MFKPTCYMQNADPNNMFLSGLELAYNEAPRTMSGLIMGLFMFTQGLGSILGTVTIYPFKGIWFSSQDIGSINCEEHCHLDYYYFFLGGLQLVGIILFIIITKVLHIGFSQGHNRKRAVSGNISETSDRSENGNVQT